MAKYEERHEINEKLNHINMTVQRMQREAGKSFVSRTTLTKGRRDGEKIIVLRSVIMNPMTTIEILRQILDEQEKIFLSTFPAISGLIVQPLFNSFVHFESPNQRLSEFISTKVALIRVLMASFTFSMVTGRIPV
jgi:hypothetical protein